MTKRKQGREWWFVAAPLYIPVLALLAFVGLVIVTPGGLDAFHRMIQGVLP